MPNYKGHLVGGLIAYLISLYLVVMYTTWPTIFTAVEWLFFALVGSLFPDVDVKSKGQNYFYWFIALLLGYFFVLKHFTMMATIGVVAVIPQLVRHRGIFHRIWFITLLPLGLAMILCSYVPKCQTIFLFDAFFFIAGAISHLWLDLGFKRMLRG